MRIPHRDRRCVEADQATRAAAVVNRTGAARRIDRAADHDAVAGDQNTAPSPPPPVS
jgi:hypothetical protein